MQPVMHMYAIYDLVAGVILGNIVQLFPHEAPARRQFADVCASEKSPVAAHPGDYALVYLGIVNVGTLDVADIGRGKGLDVSATHGQVICLGSQVG